MRVGDLVEQLIASPLPDPAAADAVAVRQSYVPTREALEVMSRVLRGADPPDGVQRTPFLLLGRRGVGKTHLLRYFFALLGDPDDPTWDELEGGDTPIRRPRRPLRGVVVDVSEAAEEPIDSLLRRRFGWSSGGPGSSGDSIPEVVALDGLSLRLSGDNDPSRVQEDLRQCDRLAAFFGEQKRCLLFVAEERDVRPGAQVERSAPLEGLAAKCSVIWLTTSSVAEMVSSSLARKRSGARSEILRLLQESRGFLPRIGTDDETFVGLYPILPDVFAGLFAMREVLPRFSPAGFVQWAVGRALERPAEEMVTLVHLFEAAAPQLRRLPHCRPLLEAAEELERGVAGRARWDMRSRLLAVVRALACLTVTGAESVDAVQVANSLLLYDASGTIPGYGMTSALLRRLEEACPERLGGQGNGEERRYRLIPDLRARPAASKAARTAAPPADATPPAAAAPTVTERPAGPAPAHYGGAGDLPWTSLVSTALIPHPEDVLQRLRSLPGVVRTTKVWETVRPVYSRLETLVQLQHRPESDPLGPLEAETCYSQLFAGNRRLFEEWNVLCAEVSSWLNWLPSFERIHRYVVESFPTGLASVDAARDRLLSALAVPHVLMNEEPRQDLEEEFARFRVQYAGYYEALHESTVGTGASRGKDTAVDATGLRNLDLLSRLPYVDKKWFHRTRVKVQWLQRRRCALPVREVLEERPRCLCNFNPSGDRTLVEAVTELNGLIREGTESIRAFLRRGAAVIAQETAGSPPDDAAAQPIASLLGAEAMMPLTPDAIEKLRDILLRHPGPFHAGR